MTAKEIEHIYDELISVYTNLKAEVVVAEIEEKTKAKVDDFIIANQSTFARPHRRDIMGVDILSYDDQIVLELSRNGLYDLLPEGLFHNDNSDPSKYQTWRKQVQQEERETRTFFAPLENEFFGNRLAIERLERKQLEQFYQLNDSFLRAFWQIDKKVTGDLYLKLVKSLPYCYKITGNIPLTELFLESVLEQPVKIERRDHTSRASLTDQVDTVPVLGHDFVLSQDAISCWTPHLDVVVGPVSRDEVGLYFKTNGILEILQIFYDYFIPMEFDVSTTVLVEDDEGFVLQEAQEPVLGVSTLI